MTYNKDTQCVLITRLWGVKSSTRIVRRRPRGGPDVAE